MKVFLAVLLCAFLAPATVRPGEKQPAKPAEVKLDGYWVGTLKAGREIPLIARFTRKDGALSGTLDSPHEGLKKLALDGVMLKERDLRFEVKISKAVFEGKFKEDGSEVAGHWKQSGLKFPLTFKRQDKPPVFTRPQEPKRPYPYLDEEVTYENRKAKVKFAGTLTLPKGKGPFPAVLLITGSGPQNRDEELLGHKPFLILADYLTRQGIAVLRVDDRGVGGSTGKTMESTTADFAEDALAGVEYLKGRKEVNPKQIGLIGHSEGGVVAPLAASQSKDVAFIVLLAGTGLPGDDVLRLQTPLILKASGSSEKMLVWLKTAQALILKAARENKSEGEVFIAFTKAWAEAWVKVPEEEKKDAKEAELVARQLFKSLSSPWFRFFLTHDPRPALRKVTCPVLALNGELDLQVPPKEHLAEIGKALKEAGNSDVTLKEFPFLNHLFQTSKTGAPAEYATIQETMAPVVLRTISEWILKRTTAVGK
jgi:pimeloyl-ACP methyl ester carboxylesterase